VHVAALCFDTNGLPTRWIAINQWVTQDYLYPAEAIIARHNRMALWRAPIRKIAQPRSLRRCPSRFPN